MQDQWQKIETAPIDVDILVITPAKWFADGRKQMMVGRVGKRGLFSSRPGWWNCRPTHWMPLPDPPRADQ